MNPDRLSGASLLIAVPVLFVTAHPAVADGIAVDKVYDPYVQPLETELEWRGIFQNDDESPDLQRQFFALGKSVSETVWLEGYVIGERVGGGGFSIAAYELELKWQLTEQGEYAFDWGALFEIERAAKSNIWEASAGVIVSREFGRWVGTANLLGIYEWGGGIRNEFESAFRAQLRYRHDEKLEPALEMFLAQDNRSAGPVLTGLFRPAAGKKLRYEVGVIFGLNSVSPDETFKATLEYEF